MAYAYMMPDGSIETSGYGQMNSDLAMRAHMVIENIAKQGVGNPFVEVVKWRGGPESIVLPADTNTTVELGLMKPQKVDTTKLDGWPTNE